MRLPMKKSLILFGVHTLAGNREEIKGVWRKNERGKELSLPLYSAKITINRKELGLWDKIFTAEHTVKVSWRAERSPLCLKTEIASSLVVPRNDSLVFSAPLVVQGFVSRSL